MVTRRSDEGEAWLLHAYFCSLDGATCCQGGYIMEAHVFYPFHMCRRVHSLNIIKNGILGRDKLNLAADHLHDRLNSPNLSCRVGGVHLVEVLMKYDLHMMLLLSHFTLSMGLHANTHQRYSFF